MGQETFPWTGLVTAERSGGSNTLCAPVSSLYTLTSLLAAEVSRPASSRTD